MNATQMPMVGVRLPREQAEQIRRLAGGERSASAIIREAIAKGLPQVERREGAP
jgi:Arc/MetJ-type ribon-helix-helix transcriptional regulator